jgi:hypothetical protein
VPTRQHAVYPAAISFGNQQRPNQHGPTPQVR